MRTTDIDHADNTAPSVFVIQLEGEFDIAERTRLLDAFAIAEAAPLAVVNFERTTYIDSSVLECLIALKVAREKQGSDLVLVGIREPVRRIFELTRVDSFFDIRPSLRDLRIDEAVHARRLTIESRPLP